MNYEEFKKYLQEHLMDCYKEIMLSEKKEEVIPEEYQRIQDVTEPGEVKIIKVPKNNGIELDAVVIYLESEPVSPTIYLRSYYDRYQMGTPIELLMTEMIYQYMQAKNCKDYRSVDLTDFKAVKNRIVIRLVNYERNRDMLKQCPHERYLDLAVTFLYLVEKNETEMASALITDQEYQEWGVKLSELSKLALDNTMRIFPSCIDSLGGLLFGKCKKMMSELPEDVAEEIGMMMSNQGPIKLFVLTNRSGQFGAGCMLYENAIRDFARGMDANVYILPSSVHEVMLVPEDEETSPSFLRDLVQDANQVSVGLIDLLSDSVYYYDREKDEITIADPERI